jgi:uncharacterized PurR-regulated membrane protein YhhQ (DUF165 family)
MTHRRQLIAGVAFLIFMGAIVLSNAMLHTFGLWHLPWGWAYPAGTVAAAITWPTRDLLSRVSGPRWGPWVGLAAVGCGALLALTISYTLAVASALAYLASEGTDWALYWALGGQTREGWRYLPSLSVSVTASAVVDSVVFLSAAGIPWAEAGPGLLFVKLAIVALVTPITFGLRDLVPVSA